MQNEQNQNLNMEPQPPVQPEVNFEPEKGSFMSSKWLKIGAGVAILMLLIGGVYLLGKNQGVKQSELNTNLLPTPNQTTSESLSSTPNQVKANSYPETLTWKTYTNNTYNYSFKYPSDWITTDPYSNVHNSPDYVGLIPLNKTKGSTVTPIYIKRMENPDNLSLEQWQNKQNSTNIGIASNIYTKDTITTTINGYTAYVNEKGHCDPVYCYETIIKAKDNFFAFRNVDLSGALPPGSPKDQIYTKEEIAHNQQIYEALLSTLKFTDQTPTPSNPTDETASWKSYSNVDYPFQIKYPISWNLRTTYGKSVNNVNNDRVAGIDISNQNNLGSTLVVNVLNYYNQASLYDWMRKYSGHSSDEIPLKPNITYKGLSAYQVTFPTNRLDTIEIYYTYKDKVIFLAWNMISQEDKTIADKIISTLTFN